MKTLLDTNILVHAYNKSSPHQRKASKIVKKALQGKIDAYVSSQVLYEFYAIVTNPKRVEHPMPSDEAAELCTELWECHEIEKMNPTPLAPKEVFNLAKEMKLSKGRIFDCVLAITAKENKIEAIYTENVDDFKNYRFVKAVNPLI
ncbi:type II toxin-antitoxin system VapC family toxin [Candidatus Bathyarchaeota archaeon]|nr:type II toxin-antitoxin system VapC family toxin [Candidatus Bathyarchaeota archaeon]